jgi:multidrug efflux pump subunit AcrA (membrane-fusion protein)
VVLDARPGEVLDAEVSEIAEQATPRMGTFEVELRLKSEPRGVRAGLPAKVELAVVLGNAATVPASALLPGRAGPELLVLDGARSRVQRRGVQIAFLSEDRAVLAGGVEDGEQVVVQGGGALGSGERVRVVPVGGEP